MNVAAPAFVKPIGKEIAQPHELLSQAHPDRLFIDVRLGEPDEEYQSYRDGHILGAEYGQIRDVFAGQPTSSSGILPLPGIADLQASLDNWNVGKDTQVIVYGPSPALAARGWWVLKWAGVENVRLLDGGLKAWEYAGGPVAQGHARPRPARQSAPLQLSEGNLATIDVCEVEALTASTILVDARDETSFLAGAVPSAINLPAADQWTPMRLLRSATEIRGIYEQAGITEQSDVVVYCGGGVLSALTFLTLQTVDTTPRLFVGSWSEWNKCKARMASSAAYSVALAQDEIDRTCGKQKP